MSLIILIISAFGEKNNTILTLGVDVTEHYSLPPTLEGGNKLECLFIVSFFRLV